MDRVGDHWEKEVDLPSANEKVLYKFVVDDEWVVDEKAPQEGDGHWNINNVLYPDQIKPKPKPEPKSEPEPTIAASESVSVLMLALSLTLSQPTRERLAMTCAYKLATSNLA